MVWDNLKNHICGMKSYGSNFSGFEFKFKNIHCVVVLTIDEDELIINPYAIAKLFVYKNSDLNNCLVIEPTETNVHIDGKVFDFYNFFEIDNTYTKVNNFEWLKKTFIDTTDSYIPPHYESEIPSTVELAISKTFLINNTVDTD
ncbi:hypothetical protein BG262_02255 [Floricoccus penangensis]|uniref:Uncharacterized protein n=1 Tax=Floricoccus penangensis TaxID=1859475 RepID=A0A9Q5JG00_9LACT|nr:DUF6037 family protein [Floricoccus penangensis]OFI46646.1 hypothetical protein BG262_02255 [Floricoccus penangensis]